MIDTDCVMVTGPYAAESSAITSPPTITCAIAAPNDRHGFERLQGSVSKPYEATKVRCARPKAGGATSAPSNRQSVRRTVRDRGVDMRTSLILGLSADACRVCDGRCENCTPVPAKLQARQSLPASRCRSEEHTSELQS